MDEIVAQEVIEKKIFCLRGYKIMLSTSLAALYGIRTKALIQSVKRNIKRFPEDFMFQLTKEEVGTLRSQFVTSKKGRGGTRYLPYAFTEQGVAMLSSVINSERAVQVNIVISRLLLHRLSQISWHRHDIADDRR